MVDPENHTTSGTTSSARPETGSRSDETRDRARETASEVKDAAWQQAQGQFKEQSGRAAEQTEKLASVLRKMANEFNEQQQPAFSNYANNFARYSDSISQRLREKDLSGLMEDAQTYSRRQPAMFVGGAIATGFLLARFLRSSESSGKTSRDAGPATATGASSRAAGNAAPDDTIRY